MTKFMLILFTFICVTFSQEGELKAAPSFKVRDIKGKMIDSNKLYGQKMTMVFFWHSCCGIDKPQLALLKEYQQQYGSDGLTIVGVAVDGLKKSAQVKKAVQKYGMNWVSVIDNNTQIKSKFNPILLPTLYLINSDGKIVDYFSGFKQEYEGQQKDFLKEAFGK